MTCLVPRRARCALCYWIDSAWFAWHCGTDANGKAARSLFFRDRRLGARQDYHHFGLK